MDNYTVQEDQPLVVGDNETSDLYGKAGQENAAVSELEERRVCFLATADPKDVEAFSEGESRDITIISRINDVRHLNKLFEAVNRKLPEGGFYTGCFQTSEQLKQTFLNAHPKWIAWPYYVLIFLVKRVLPKLALTKSIYFRLTDGRNRALSKAEVLGRLVYCGFEIVEYREIGHEMYFIVRKVQKPANSTTPSMGLIFKARRMGHEGVMFNFYKLRTMHPYAEYLQSYIYHQNKLQQNGKFKDDFRITTWGRLCRKMWIDELPMLINWLKGDLKLVGPRPLTEHYMNLYPRDVIERRQKVKPGLLPPFYVDLPESFDEIVTSEDKYLQAYERHPIKTDIKYFFLIMYSILLKGARSE